MESEKIKCGTEGAGKIELKILTFQKNGEMALEWLKEKGVVPGNPEKFVEEHH